MLLFYTEFMKFTLPVFLTFNQAKAEEVSVNKGAHSFPVYYWFKFVVRKDSNKSIPYEEYCKLSKAEKDEYKVIPQMKYYNVFNLDQTNFAEKYPNVSPRCNKASSPKTIRTVSSAECWTN
ncbi:ArdC family protein [Bacteroides sp. CR5/BHMF/2]|nr:ArdC family protein [Bacteroides sp. CR5/BHMF/2]